MAWVKLGTWASVARTSRPRFDPLQIPDTSGTVSFYPTRTSNKDTRPMASKSETLLAKRQKFVPKGVSNLSNYFAASARGAVITDVEGRELIDFAGGIGVLNVGHCHPKVVAALKAQADKFLHTCIHVVQYEQYIELAERLVAIAPGDFEKKAAFFNSGAEAVENAVKVARHYTKRSGVLAFETGFHGRTLLTMSLTSKLKPYKFGFGPYAPEIYRMPYPYCYRCHMGLEYPSCGVACADKLRDFFIGNAAAEQLAALIIEPIVGEGGFLTPPPLYFQKLKAICEEFGILFIADEVQSGFGRTGKMFAMQHYDVAGDLCTVAKSMGAGMPISGVVGRSEILDDPMVGGIGGTYGGNPMSCAAALAVFDIFEEENLLETSVALGEKVRARFEAWQDKYEIIGEVRGLGPMLALELVEDRATKKPAADKAKALSRYCVDNGLILLSCGNYGNVIRTLMPLVITDEQLERGLAIMEEGLKTVSK